MNDTDSKDPQPKSPPMRERTPEVEAECYDFVLRFLKSAGYWAPETVGEHMQKMWYEAHDMLTEQTP